MEIMGFVHFCGFISLFILVLFDTSMAGVQSIGKLDPGFQGSQMNWIDSQGFFLVSNQSKFGLGFITTSTDVTLFLLVVIHMGSQRVIWTANRDSPVANSDNFVFDKNGNAFLQKGGTTVWTTNTAGKGVSAMELQDSGNLVFRGNDSKVIWQSFDHPTDTLISKQNFAEGMKLVSVRNSNNASFVLEIKSGDMILSAAYFTPQPYWTIKNDVRKIINKNGGQITSASLNANSWGFYDQDKALLLQFTYSDDTENVTWVAVLGNDGFISFYNLDDVDSGSRSPTKIPDDPCGTPEPCDPYYICSGNTRCQCPQALTSRNCKTGITSPCSVAKDSVSLMGVGDGLTYFALGYISPSLKTDLNSCKASCLRNCSCLGMFFENTSGNCFLLDHIGSFQNSGKSSDFVSFIKVLGNGGTGGNVGVGERSKKRFPYVAIIVIVTVLVISGMLFMAFRYYKKKSLPESPEVTSEEDNILETMSGMPTRFSYKDLQTATNNFAVRLGRGGFGSVYQGVLPDGSQVAVKKLEGIGQGKKEFRAEVSIIGSIHHLHLVRLKGFCAEGSHRLLAYEYMANGSLDKWIFRRNTEDFLLDWETRFSVAVGTAKGLAYLHEECHQKIVHCDIKPENVLLDEHFLAKVSDFGLAKLMTREQSHVFTTLRGTRGYLAPEWITNYAISEKSDVYSYGMVLLEIIGGRKNFDPTETSEKSHYPSYAFKMMEEGKFREILDSRLQIDEEDERICNAIKVALWCIQEDTHRRPSMTRVVQMLQGLCAVPKPPISSPLGSRLYAGFIKSSSEGGTSSGPSDCNSDAYQSAVRLSGPR